MVISPSVLGWTILLAPLVAACGVQAFGVGRRRLSATLAIGALLVSFASATLWYLGSSVLTWAVPNPFQLPFESSVSWIALPGLSIQFGVLIDPLSLLMTLVVTGVGSAIFIYSTAYMKEDHAYSRFFGVLSLFAFSMLTIVLSTNWIQLFMGWELVGLSSYLLIGHWYAKPSAADAGKKAFMVNRVADFGFMLGILALWAISSPVAAERTFNFLQLEHQLPGFVTAGMIPVTALPLIGLLLFCGPIGKSAQFPLHVWLPDAMEGPTPVSALIHAATMVAAGVYLLCRSFWLFAMLPSVLTTIMWVGGATAFLAACLALVEDDLKKILAYSTLSQLGYMVMALGLGGRAGGEHDYAVGMYHLTTHAFFKALLFLGAGSVIHGTHEQNIRKLGGLWHSMRWTSVTFLIGSLALCGVWPLSGFFSKDAILALAFEHQKGLYVLGTITAGMTAFYTARAWFVAFTGHGHTHAHESSPVMLVPLFLLAGLSITAGYLGIPHFLGLEHEEANHLVMGISLGVVGVGLFLAWLVYSRKLIDSQQVVQALALPYSFLQRRYYIDEIYDWYVANVQQRLIAGVCAWVERYLIIGFFVNGIAALTRGLGRLLRLLQTGQVQFYVLGFLLGVIGLLYTVLHP